MDSDEKVRLSKLMAQQGFCSRREADELISKGWVRVDGEVVSTLGTKVHPLARIELLRKGEASINQKVTILLNKPVGYVSSQPEKGYRAAVELIQASTQDTSGSNLRFHRSHLRGLAPAGRLDIDSQGLLVLTQDGRVAKSIIGANSSIEKEYLVRVEGQVDAEVLNKLRHGLSLDGKPLKPAKVEQINPEQLQFILKEGRKRQLRRMCELVGLRVTGLKRVRIGQVKLGRLKEGQWRYLGPNERF